MFRDVEEFLGPLRARDGPCILEPGLEALSGMTDLELDRRLRQPVARVT